MLIKKINIFLSLISLTALNACMTYDPYTDEQKVSSATTGAIIGGVTGVVLGNQVKGNSRTREQARIAGGLIGAGVGGSMGHKKDQQEAQLRHKLRGTGVSVSKQGKQIVLNMPGNITFDKNSSAVKPEFEDVLDSVASVIKEFDTTMVEISGHADSSGSIATNQMISEQRANSVASYLRSKGVKANRIIAQGYGKSNAISGDDAYNRRVEIKLTTPE